MNHRGTETQREKRADSAFSLCLRVSVVNELGNIMKLGISYWSIEGGLANTRPIEEAMKEAKGAGFDGIELAIGTEGVLHTQSDQATCESYRKAAERIGINVKTLAAGLTWGCSPTSPDE